MLHRRFVLPSADGEPIRGDLRCPTSGGPFPVVVVCHGFKGFKDWGFHPFLGETLAVAGFAAVHFNFSRDGVGEDLLEFTELEKFRRNTPSIEVRDLGTVISALPSLVPDVPLDLARIGVAGHSRGGGVAILGAADDGRVRAVVTWAAISTFDRMRDEETLSHWRERGFTEVVNARTGQVLPMGVEFLDDVETNRERLDVLAAAGRLRCPLRLVHGTADEAVPFAEAEAIRGAANRAVPVDLVAIEGAGHTFGAVHPWAGTTPHLRAALDATVGWFSSFLGPVSRP